MSLASRGLVGLVRYYQRALSPRKPVPTCRFTPSCSEYAAQAIELHGAVKGGWLATWRVLRCNPAVPGGYDPVPELFPGQPPSPQDGAVSPASGPPPAAPTAPPPPTSSRPSPNAKKRPVS